MQTNMIPEKNQTISPGQAGQPAGSDRGRIEVLYITPLATPKGALIGFAGVRLNGRGYLTIHDLRIIQQSGQRAWVSMPAKSYTDQQGQTHWSSIVEADKELMAKIQAAVLETWEREGRP